jgi:hypothetical protein
MTDVKSHPLAILGMVFSFFGPLVALYPLMSLFCPSASLLPISADLWVALSSCYFSTGVIMSSLIVGISVVVGLSVVEEKREGAVLGVAAAVMLVLALVIGALVGKWWVYIQYGETLMLGIVPDAVIRQGTSFAYDTIFAMLSLFAAAILYVADHINTLPKIAVATVKPSSPSALSSGAIQKAMEEKPSPQVQIVGLASASTVGSLSEQGHFFVHSVENHKARTHYSYWERGF